MCDGAEQGETDRETDALADLRWIGPATEAVLVDAELTVADIRDRRVSYRLLVDAGVNPGVAAKIRREHSLSWSFEAGDGLDRRSAQVRGLGGDEAAWVAASVGDWESAAPAVGDDESGAPDDGDDDTAGPGGSGRGPVGGRESAGDWEPAGDWESAGDWPSPDSDDAVTADGSGDPVEAETAWRARSTPTPLSTLSAVPDDAIDQLAEAGITSVRSLATADPEHVADVLGLDPDRVERWNAAARDARE